MMRRLKVLGVLSALCLVNGCQSGLKADVALTATVLYQGQQCGRSESSAAATQIADSAALLALSKRVDKQFSFAETMDFQQQILLLVEVGMRPTPGYRLLLHDATVNVHQGRAQLMLDWIQPPADAMLAQMLTSPCLLLSLPVADYFAIDVVDGNGDTRFSVGMDNRAF